MYKFARGMQWLGQRNMSAVWLCVCQFTWRYIYKYTFYKSTLYLYSCARLIHKYEYVYVISVCVEIYTYTCLYCGALTQSTPHKNSGMLSIFLVELPEGSGNIQSISLEFSEIPNL